LRKLANSLSRLIKAKDLYTGHIRVLPLTRLFKHGKIFLPAQSKLDWSELLLRYPSDCSDEEKYTVHQIARTILNPIHGEENRYKSKQWPKYFWRHNFNLVPCSPVKGSLEEGDIKDDDKLKELQSILWNNSIYLIAYLDKIAKQYKYDLYDPTIDEIKLGLFSRIVRLYILLISDPFLWCRDICGIILRCIGETAIVYYYLVKNGTAGDFRSFREYALGKEKLLMLHMQDDLDVTSSLEGKSVDDISYELGGNFATELLKIDLKGWTKKNIRDLAQEAGLDKIYKWVVDPSNAEIHGSWSSIRKSNLVVCSQILHRFHKVPKYYEPPMYLAPIYVATQIYNMCQKLAISEIGCPPPDQEIKEVQEIANAFNRVFQKFD
jgi:hypothetical protein